MKLLKELNNSLKPVDPLAEAIKSLHENPDWTTQLDDEQIDMLADYMKEIIDSSTKRGQQMPPEKAAGMALEDVAGFETASPKVMKATIARLIQAFNKKNGL